jgi:DNA-binding beta-propeller fold protein YncE
MTNAFTTTGGTSHSRSITGLANGNTYSYYVRCIDSVGNVNTNDFTISFSVASSGGTNETTPQTIIASLVQTIDTSQFSPPSPDPAGIAYLAASNRLLMSDSEVDEMTIWNGANIFEMTLSGNLIRTTSTTSFSKEPTGVAYNPVNGHVFISDDSKKRIFEIDTGADSLAGTGDDIITSFNTTSFGCDDPEGVAFGQSSIFIAGGVGRKVFRISPGFNGVFDGVSPAGDDQVSHFDTSVLGLSDPEGIEFNPDRNTLYILSRNRAMRETTLDGNHVSVIDISAANAVSPAGLAYGPGSLGPTKKSIYITARGIDNGNNPTENDGKIYEMSLS